MNSQQIARITHEVNRAYCQALGDTSQAAWADASEWQKESALNGVMFFLLNPNATPEEQHAKWAEDKRAQGWTYGTVKDADAKTHPCLVPYDELPERQRAKDFIFQAIVRELMTL